MAMARAIESMGLEGVWNLKPMFNGGEVKKILPKIPRGPVFSKVMDVSVQGLTFYDVQYAFSPLYVDLTPLGGVYTTYCTREE